jgi:hypothetical protein
MTTLTLLNGTAPVDDWKVSWDAAGGSLLGTFNAGVTASGTSYSATAPEWNTSLEAGEEISFGYVAEGSPTPTPSNVKLNGVSCTVTSTTSEDAGGSMPEPTMPEPTDTVSPTSAGPTGPVPAPSTTQPSGSADCTVQVREVLWPTLHLTTLTLLNGAKKVGDWKVTFDAAAGSLRGAFSADLSVSGTSYTVTAPYWNQVLDVGEEVYFGYVSEGAPTPTPSNVKLNGAACVVTGTTMQSADGSTLAQTNPVPTTMPEPPSPTTSAPKSGGDMFAETFEDGQYDDWSGSGGSWKVMKGSWTIANVLQQTDSTAAASQLVAGARDWSDYMVEAHLRVAECGKARECAIGIAARVDGNSSARLVLIPGYGGQLQVIRNGRVKVASSVPFDMKVKQWRIIRLEANGGTVTATIDGTVIGTAKGIPATGRVGIFTEHASASFDNINVFSRA